MADKVEVPDALTIHSLRKTLSPFAKSDRRKAILQLINTFIPYFALWAVIVYLVNHQYHFALIFSLIIIASLFLVRIFIFFHDCAHSSFFSSYRANTLLGHLSGLLTFTPFAYWRYNHLIHHGTYADLDHRGIGDIWTLTVEEYRASSKMRQWGYRIYRHPLVFLGIGPGYSFLITQRFMHKLVGKPERNNAAITNVGIVAVVWGASMTMGLKTYLMIQIPIILIAGAMGVWLFYVQHQFEGVYWSRHERWDPLSAALKGSSYYKLPGVLRWFSGNIGLHHVHHVLPRIPNYKLQQGYSSSPVLQEVAPLSLSKSLKSFSLNLWDERQQKLVSFKSLKEPVQ